MKAQSLSINLAGPCDANCPFCIADVTWKTGIKSNERIFKNLNNVLEFAKYHGVDTVLITGSGEPALLADEIVKVTTRAKWHRIPIVELQTNGKVLMEDELLEQLDSAGLNTVAISIASFGPECSAEIMGLEGFDYFDLVKRVNDLGMLCRISINMIEGEINPRTLRGWAEKLYRRGVHQLTLRELGLPKYGIRDKEGNEAVRKKREWVEMHKASENVVQVIKNEVANPERLLRELSFGIKIYDYENLSVGVTTCMTDNPNPDEIRSLILQPDGHVYHSWNFVGSVLL